MKHIKAIIRPEMLDSVRTALDNAGCYRGITISEVMGHGAQKGVVQVWRGEKYQVDLLPKIMLDMIVKDTDVPVIKKAILESVQTGENGDGKIFVYNVEEAVRISTGEEGDLAL